MKNPEMTREILTAAGYPADRMDRVTRAILAHRGSGTMPRDTLEAQILADADAMSHFDNVAMLFNLAYGELKLDCATGREYVRRRLTGSFAKLRPESQKLVQEKFDRIMEVIG